ncbi:hypothetical protein BV25DRAFT_988169 [Artomyces pyxidatus]|uniref:Uncharacterized protein n=1 Tax=Artomyces pyxidatus TaxID=48021 RepID=A0ACB8SVK8_9AGAM|nr:hypothetical protein BV25DRAFT_988169 [Artomyces pyxidatus]
MYTSYASRPCEVVTAQLLGREPAQRRIDQQYIHVHLWIADIAGKRRDVRILLGGLRVRCPRCGGILRCLQPIPHSHSNRPGRLHRVRCEDGATSPCCDARDGRKTAHRDEDGRKCGHDLGMLIGEEVESAAGVDQPKGYMGHARCDWTQYSEQESDLARQRECSREKRNSKSRNSSCRWRPCSQNLCCSQWKRLTWTIPRKDCARAILGVRKLCGRRASR